MTMTGKTRYMPPHSGVVSIFLGFLWREQEEIFYRYSGPQPTQIETNYVSGIRSAMYLEDQPV
jgi:hypothetical protein